MIISYIGLLFLNQTKLAEQRQKDIEKLDAKPPSH